MSAPAHPSESRRSPVAPPDPMSEACSRFFHDHWELASFHLYVYLLAIDKDRYERLLARAMLEHERMADADKCNAADVARHGFGAVDALVTRQQMLLQILLCRAVDGYLTYLSDLLALVFATRPETMRGGEQVSYKDILQFKSMDDLVASLAERKVHELAYKSMRDLAKYMTERCGFDVCETPAALDRITLVIELRNLIAHNRAVINRIFKDRQKDYPGNVGEVVTLDMAQTMGDIDLLAASVADIEARAAAKWCLPRPVARAVHDERMAGLERVMDMVEKGLEEMHAEYEKQRDAPKT